MLAAYNADAFHSDVSNIGKKSRLKGTVGLPLDLS
jgi:hypothetical protein